MLMTEVFFKVIHFLFGHKTTSCFDVWSVVHFVSGVVVGTILLDIVERKKPKMIPNPVVVRMFQTEIKIWLDFIVLFLLTYSWEMFEFGAERGMIGNTVANWLAGKEFWANRFFADPLLVHMGYCLGRSLFVKPANTNALGEKTQKVWFGFVKFEEDKLVAIDRGLKANAVYWGARIFATSWLLLNILMPNSMFLQQQLLSLF